jgi:hypothetical protein
MTFTVEITETTKDDPPQVIKRYEQTVDALDIRLVQKAVNTAPRKPRVRKAKPAP